jgi:sodium-dependent dicarboxylate transporter 2/3/5
LAVFAGAAFLWIFRSDLNFGFLVIPGWSNIFPNKEFIDDGTVAITMALLLFIIPAKDQKENSSKILDITAFRKIPWEIIILFGGGFALAEGFVESGLSKYISKQFTVLTDIPIYFMLLIICLAITFLTELTSNTATSQIILPILASLSMQLNVNPILIMIPASFSASMAFMMPVATPPNAIVFGSGKLKVYNMARAGIILNIIGALSISLYIYLIFG